jgi:hypothetical protein
MNGGLSVSRNPNCPARIYSFRVYIDFCEGPRFDRKSSNERYTIWLAHFDSVVPEVHQPCTMNRRDVVYG